MLRALFRGPDVKIYAGSDHAGFMLKTALVDHLRRAGHDVVDLGPRSDAAADYPDYAAAVAEAVREGEAFTGKRALGLLVCGSGVGVCMVANKVHGVRAVDAWNPEVARVSRSHNDSNVLCLGARFVSEDDARAITEAWLETPFEGGRHARRVAKIAGVESREDAAEVVRRAVDALDAASVPARIWRRDPLAFTPEAASDRGTRSSIGTRLGWLDSPGDMATRLAAIVRLKSHAAALGLTDAVLLGMGGSSLAPEVLSATFPAGPGALRLHVLDDTDPEAVAAVERSVDLARTLFVVASKSGSTIEVAAFEAHFWALATARLGQAAARERFCAITDPGTRLAEVAAARYAHSFLNDPNVGGRFSAISHFGLVPAALLGLDVERLVRGAADMGNLCRAERVSENPGARLGAWMGALAQHGRDKLTLLLSPALSAFGGWLEQLVAESTGKQGKGLVPVQGESVGAPEVYGRDRAFVLIGLRGDAPPAPPETVAALRAGGHPIEQIELGDPYELGGEFFRWQFATAIAGAVLRLNPFDEPNVKEAKDATAEALASFARSGALPTPAGAVASPSEGDAVAALLATAGAGDYVAICAFFRSTPARDQLLAELQALLRDRVRVPVTVGHGPRFLHSTGQLHKGGPNTGLFLQLTADAAPGSPVPGHDFDFRTLRDAQALGDLAALGRRARRALRVHLGAEVEAGLDRLRALAAGLPLRSALNQTPPH
jgi:RpiB/LacA/LacB family sugar-phosphate isomerase